ncbi:MULTISPECIES: hypothetical protein [unclassified Polaribacter]|uniref:hypothetical protein n=1 Tax=unclassified Polaribacter TaxID=196858 RepID=UPI0011BEBD42|nr:MULTISPECIES: hypothetical protein [unclassified Polaribacter]TXD50241.1 hypothetical protein ES043_16910 [Polaribacter sp. IC063]TXD56304.1 hypothetical protein ES044_17075 [Polaribacter sp. IC066]
MKSLKIVSAFVVLFLGFFSFSKAENTTLKTSLNLEEINVLQQLSKQDFECRPSEEVSFYVETALVKKHRGFNTIKASVFVLDRLSGQSNLLTNENILISNHKDAVLYLDNRTDNYQKAKLKNGDKIVVSNTKSKYSFHELMKNEAIYNSYMRATNTLLNLDRAF